ncbi:MAG: hydroxymethylbilane synthase [Candidatus Zixiibacteriota bacterium]|nr:MAG: hydroxymethylbilane synthase [candidate division Zixibacteria bacterium]
MVKDRSTEKRRIVIGTRGSDLALVQSRQVASALEQDQGCVTKIQIISTTGDRLKQRPFNKIGQKGLFTKELEEALLAGEIDLAVHSLKDLMTAQPPGLKLGAVGFRADRRDLLLISPGAHVEDGVLPVKQGAVIGTGSVRRECQIAHHHPTAIVKNLRGNVVTRVNKLRDGQFDAIVIAAAGVERLQLDLSDFVPVFLDPEQFLPAPGQGILGLQIRSDDQSMDELIAPLNSAEAALEADLERGLLSRFDAGCSLPLGVHSQVNGETMRLHAVLGQGKAGRWTGLSRVEVEGDDAEEVVNQAYSRLIEKTTL